MRSSGVLLYRRETDSGVSVLLGHMGGPFWAKKDAAAWSIPKGETLPGESDLDAALREFAEETGSPAPAVGYHRLGEFRQSSGKVVVVFAAEADFAAESLSSNTFPLEWPPRSGRIEHFPELDRADWFSLAAAPEKVVKGQVAALDALAAHLRDTA